MSVYGDVRFLDEAVESVLAQTFDDFELVVVDDGSEDPAPVASLAKRDARVRTVANDRNLGLARSLNRGVALARAPIIARMDADDICHPSRLEALCRALDEDPALTVVGSRFVTTNEAGEDQESIAMPRTHPDVVWASLFFNPFCHSAIAFRRDAFEAVGGYDPAFEASQDYDLWVRMLASGRGGNLDEPLLRFRLNPRGISALKAERQRMFAGRARLRTWAALGIEPPTDIASLAILASGFRLMPIERHLSELDLYLSIYEDVRPRLAAAFPSLRAEEVDDIGMRLRAEARHYLTLVDPALDGARAVAARCDEIARALGSEPELPPEEPRPPKGF
ncbi:MAG: glycosyltransferase [Salinarimonas sp.]